MNQVSDEVLNWVSVVCMFISVAGFLAALFISWREKTRWKRASGLWQDTAEVWRRAAEQAHSTAYSWRELALSMMGEDQRRAFLDHMDVMQLGAQIDTIAEEEADRAPD